MMSAMSASIGVGSPLGFLSRITSVEREIAFLKQKVEDDARWKHTLQQWILDNFAFDIQGALLRQSQPQFQQQSHVNVTTTTTASHGRVTSTPTQTSDIPTLTPSSSSAFTRPHGRGKPQPRKSNTNTKFKSEPQSESEVTTRTTTKPLGIRISQRQHGHVKYFNENDDSDAEAEIDCKDHDDNDFMTEGYQDHEDDNDDEEPHCFGIMENQAQDLDQNDYQEGEKNLRNTKMNPMDLIITPDVDVHSGEEVLEDSSSSSEEEKRRTHRKMVWTLIGSYPNLESLHQNFNMREWALSTKSKGDHLTKIYYYCKECRKFGPGRLLIRYKSEDSEVEVLKNQLGHDHSLKTRLSDEMKAEILSLYKAGMKNSLQLLAAVKISKPNLRQPTQNQICTALKVQRRLERKNIFKEKKREKKEKEEAKAAKRLAASLNPTAKRNKNKKPKSTSTNNDEQEFQHQSQPQPQGLNQSPPPPPLLLPPAPFPPAMTMTTTTTETGGSNSNPNQFPRPNITLTPGVGGFSTNQNQQQPLHVIQQFYQQQILQQQQQSFDPQTHTQQQFHH